MPSDLARYIARKGSVAVDGVSLTVNEVEAATFGVNIIPHTQTVTTLGKLVGGSRVNLEVDQVAQERLPATLVLDSRKPSELTARGEQERDVAHLAGPGLLRHNSSS